VLLLGRHFGLDSPVDELQVGMFIDLRETEKLLQGQAGVELRRAGHQRNPLPTDSVQEPAVAGRAYAPLFPGFSGVFMENITESYNVT